MAGSKYFAAALNGTCADLSYRTMYDQGRIHITMKNVSSSDSGESYMLTAGITAAEGKQFVLDMISKKQKNRKRGITVC